MIFQGLRSYTLVRGQSWTPETCSDTSTERRISMGARQGQCNLLTLLIIAI